MPDAPLPIAFQGAPGAYSHQACAEAFPGLPALPCTTFEAAIAAVREGAAGLAMLPVENSTYGRVADIHQLLPEFGPAHRRRALRAGAHQPARRCPARGSRTSKRR